MLNEMLKEFLSDVSFYKDIILETLVNYIEDTEVDYLDLQRLGVLKNSMVYSDDVTPIGWKEEFYWKGELVCIFYLVTADETSFFFEVEYINQELEKIVESILNDIKESEGYV